LRRPTQLQAKRIVISVAILALLLATGGGASADPGDDKAIDRGPADVGILALIADDDVFSLADLSLVMSAPTVTGGSTATQHYGPYASDSPDSGTCGDWATDTFDRHFTVRQESTNVFTVVEQFKNGAFETIAGPSPGSCDTTDGSPPGTVNGGVLGAMHGYLVMTETGAQTSTDPSCVAGSPSTPCTTTGFMTSHFAGGFTVGTFFFHYSASDQGLVEHEWKNASADRGGNHGDIRSTNVP
jgi:hypothetical protein